MLKQFSLFVQKLKDVEPIIRIEDVDGARLVQDFADEIERMLGSKMKSVKFDYFNALLVNTMDEEGNFIELGGEFPLEENEHFNKLSVNTLMSDIQVPTNVYNKDPDILNGVYMSEALNDIFINNFQKDPTLTWQYFGSSAGFFRLYPGIKWTPDANGVVSFDCRNRNWYIQAATSPKDIVIVVDVSGSMKGLKMTIAKHTINTILDTLGENDFVNVIAYTDYVRYVEPCFKGTLVQADLDNREHFKLLVEELHVKGEAKVKKAMKESFRILADVTNGQGSLCNQAIMLITDGAMEDFQSVFEEFNWPDKKVRVFTYLIGRDMTFSENVKWIACNNKGYYTHISTLADVQENVMEYLHVLSRPMVINHDHDIIWTEAYMDSVLPNTKELFKSKAHSLLLMTSVAMPVFSKKKETLSHGILLGVVGTDVPLLEVMKLAPRYKLGAHGYAFLITNNGYILAHPDLRPLYSDGKKLKPKPNYNSVDLSEAEWEDTEDSLRTAMVKGETGTLNLDVRAAVDKGVSVCISHLLCYNVKLLELLLLGELNKGHGQYVFFGNVSVEEVELWSLVYPLRTYCETDIDPHHRKLTQLQAVVRYLTGKEPDLECDEILLQQVLFDAVVTAPLEAYWTALTLTAPGVDEGMESAFLGTRSGLMRVIRYAGSEKRVGKKFLTPVDKENLFTVDHFPIWYRLAAENKPGQFFFYVPHDEINKGFNKGDQFLSNCFSQDVNCYLVDNNGFIMVSKEKGDVSISYTSLNTQTFCDNMPQQHFVSEEKHKMKDGDLPYPSVIMKILFSPAHRQKKVELMQPCNTEYPGFMYDTSIRETNSIIKCGRCQKMFVLQQVPNSNLVMLVVQADCDCSRQYAPITLAPRECNRMKSQKIRRRPESCHAYHPHENAKDCGGACGIAVSLTLYLICLATSLALR
uniref:Voltage-dependent calcium channel subunit alpha-2/delta-4-like n=1 Tax=Sinocyclocheilus grahami TaxID=75366 RepID=A0A672SIP8_SINGR